MATGSTALIGSRCDSTLIVAPAGVSPRKVEPEPEPLIAPSSSSPKRRPWLVAQLAARAVAS